jgi:hypothetical protein
MPHARRPNVNTKLMKIVMATVAFGTIAIGVAAYAAPPPPPDGVEYKKETKYDFDDDTVEGDLVKPEGEMIGSAGKAKHSSLIKVRQHFIPEMLKSAEDI